MKIKWNPFNFCWEFWMNGKLISTCDDSEYNEMRKEIEKE